MAQFCLVHRHRDKFILGSFSSITTFYDSGSNEHSDIYRSQRERHESTSAFWGMFCPGCIHFKKFNKFNKFNKF